MKIINERLTTYNRETWIDLLKGVLILFVILGHSIEQAMLINILSSFYMPCFFILSGWLMKKDANARTFIFRKVKGVLCAYFFFAVIWVLFCFAKSFIIESDFNLFRALLSIILPYSGSPYGNAYNLWFLPCLFLSQTLFALFIYKKTIWKSLTVFLWIVFMILGIFIKPYCSLLYTTAVATIFIAVGYYFSNYIFSKINLKSCSVFICAMIISVVIYVGCFILNVFIFDNNLEYSNASFGVLPIYIIGSIFGSTFFILIAKKIKTIKPLEYIGKNSLVYYALHYEVLALVGYIIPKFISNFILEGFLIFIMTLGLTTVVVFIYNLLKIGKLFK